MDNSLDLALGSDKTAVEMADGNTVNVRVVIMENLTAFYDACAPFFSEFDTGKLARKEGATGSALEDFTLFGVLAQHSKAFMKAAALVTDADYTYFAKLPPDEFFKVAAKVVEVNGTFFVNALAPSLIALAKGVNGVGLMLSALSSAQGTTATPYEATL